MRHSLERLLMLYPFHDVVEVEWQIDPADERQAARWSGPWVLVTLGQPSDHIDVEPAWARWQFAIWRATGAIFRVGADGAVDDDHPVWTPS